MIKRVAQRVRNGFGPSEKLVPRRNIAGAKFFRNAIRPHRAPFIMVAFEPDFEEVVEPAVARDVAWRDVAVIIKNRLNLGEFVEKPAGGF